MLYPLMSEKQDVDVDDAWAPTLCWYAPALSLDLLGRLQQLTWSAQPIHLDDLVQEPRLFRDAPRLCLDDAALTQDACPFLTQTPTRRAQVARPRSKIRSKAQVGGRQRMRSAI
jgi:hypothetical protein